IAFPVASFTCGSESVGERTDEMIRSPVDPVSTWTWSIVWQLVLDPGAQRVTLVKIMLGMLAGPPSTMTGCEFGVGGLGDDPPPPPPQAPSESTAATLAAARHSRCHRALIEYPLRARPEEGPRACTLCR